VKQPVAIHARAKARKQTKHPIHPIHLIQPSLRTLITGILRKADKPPTVQEISAATRLAGSHWRSQVPITALNVKLYTDTAFKQDSHGRFMLQSN